VKKNNVLSIDSDTAHHEDESIVVTYFDKLRAGRDRVRRAAEQTIGNDGRSRPTSRRAQGDYAKEPATEVTYGRD
jgi:hypothetical protein